MTVVGRPPNRGDSLIALSVAAVAFVVYALGANVRFRENLKNLQRPK